MSDVCRSAAQSHPDDVPDALRDLKQIVTVPARRLYTSALREF